MNSTNPHPGSFRDPSGYLFYSDNTLYRSISPDYKTHYDFFMKHLYGVLRKQNLIVAHDEIHAVKLPNAYQVIRPQAIPFISYPYEWAFSALKNAALLTLKIQKLCIEHGMTLKDSSAYNVQFIGSNPIFIDTLSFEIREEGTPWKAYRQFCMHFLAPLSLMAYSDVRLCCLLKSFLDGVPLDLTSRLLPMYTWLLPSYLFHIHLHAKKERQYSKAASDVLAAIHTKKQLSTKAMLNLIEHLGDAINGLHWRPNGTEWAEYENKMNYSSASFADKQNIVNRYLEAIKPKQVWDVGGNTGSFSRLALKYTNDVICFDIDPGAIEKNYQSCLEKQESILPLLLDLTNPSPGIGWNLEERNSIMDRGPTDTVLALALFHHLAISNNVPLAQLAKFFGSLCDNLIIEFVPKNDSRVQFLLASRKDIFPDYTESGFERAFSQVFHILDKTSVIDSARTIYRMSRRS